ncbi:type IV secretion system protein [Collinsella intestinalis]|uniref:type IV secretion system protein n=1 Tax=Collinsella intestinalis TaxID=147207 RepID=UPI0026727929|nr:type IV secretion system protein [Collinsella intestinalis]
MIRDRVESFIGGAPLGSHPLTADGPYEVRMARRDRRWKRMMTAMLIIMLVSMTALAATAWAQNMPGYWFTSSAPGPQPDGTFKQTWYWCAQDGSKPAKVIVKLPGDSEPVEHSNPVILTDQKTAITGPSDAPQGWYKVYENSITQGGLEQNMKDPKPDPDSPEGQNSMYYKTIYDNDPKFELSGTFLTNWAMKMVYSFCYMASEGMLSIADWFMGVIGANAQSILSEEFATGTFADFYRIASKVSDYAVEPYALAFLACVFGVAMIRISDPRRRSQSQDYMEEMLMLLAMFAVCVTLILHAMDLCALVYWLARNLVTGVGQALDQIGMNPADSGAGTVSAVFLDGMRRITYGQAGSVLVYALLALVCLAVSAGCAIVVLTTIFMRAGEIYLRAAASPLCLSFLVDDRARQVGMGYIKRFCSVCFQAAIIFIAIALSPLFFQVSATLMSNMGAGSIAGTGGVLETMLPTMVALFAVTGIVRQSEHVANSMFGLAG